MSISPDTHVELESTIRRVFNIPDHLELVLSTELPAFQNAKPEIDPQIWHLIKPQVTSLWIDAVNRVDDKQKSWKERIKDMLGPKIASTSTSGTSLLRFFYNQRAIVTISPDEPTSLELAARRLFRLPEDRPLILFAELPEMEAERLEIDPQMWNAIKFQVTDVWIQLGAIPAPPPSTKRVTVISTYTESMKRKLKEFHF